MVPMSFSLSQSASGRADGGTQGITNNVLHEGDWVTSSGANSPATAGLTMNKALLYGGAAVAVLWLLKHRKK
jgi:hypothetical protein